MYKFVVTLKNGIVVETKLKDYRSAVSCADVYSDIPILTNPVQMLKEAHYNGKFENYLVKAEIMFKYEANLSTLKAGLLFETDWSYTFDRILELESKYNVHITNDYDKRMYIKNWQETLKNTPSKITNSIPF